MGQGLDVVACPLCGKGVRKACWLCGGLGVLLRNTYDRWVWVGRPKVEPW